LSTAAGDQTTADQTTADQTTADKTTGDQTTADQTTADQTTADQTTAAGADDDARYELHGAAEPDADALHVLQLRLPHLLVDGIVLHPHARHARPLLENVPLHSTDGAQVSTDPLNDL